MSFKMAVEALIGDISISKTYSDDDVIWKKQEPEKRIRQMLADVRRELEKYNLPWIMGRDVSDIEIKQVGTTNWDWKSVEGCAAINEEVLIAIIKYTDSVTPDPLVVRG